MKFELFSWPPIASHLMAIFLGFFCAMELSRQEQESFSFGMLDNSKTQVALKVDPQSWNFSNLPKNKPELLVVRMFKNHEVRCWERDLQITAWGKAKDQQLWLGFDKKDGLRAGSLAKGVGLLPGESLGLLEKRFQATTQKAQKACSKGEVEGTWER